jgi:hypothetical protein
VRHEHVQRRTEREQHERAERAGAEREEDLVRLDAAPPAQREKAEDGNEGADEQCG